MHGGSDANFVSSIVCAGCPHSTQFPKLSDEGVYTGPFSILHFLNLSLKYSYIFGLLNNNI